MAEGQSAAARDRVVLVDGPLRLWHWLLAACLSFSLYTGLSGDLALVDWHMRSGYAICALLLFRLGWWFWGATYSRWRHYGFGWQGWRAWLGRAETSARRVRTAPGAALSLTMIALLFLQAGAGLMTTDDIFTEGPLVRYAPEAWVSAASTLHRQLYYLVMGAVGVHLLAHVVYGLRRDPLPLAMIHGRKAASLPPTPHRAGRAVLTALGCALLVWGGVSWL